MRLHLLQWQSFFHPVRRILHAVREFEPAGPLDSPVRARYWNMYVACTVRSRFHNTTAAQHSVAAACMPYGLCMSYEILLWVPQDNDFYPESLCYSLSSQCLFCRFVHLCVCLLVAIRISEVCVAWLFGCRYQHTATEKEKERESKKIAKHHLCIWRNL